MKKALIVLYFLISCASYSQTFEVEIDAKCVAYSEVHHKAFVIVRVEDSNYSKNLLQLNPYTGTVEKNLILNGNPNKIKLTPCEESAYISYEAIAQIDKVNLSDFQITETILTDGYSVVDFEISPINENILFAVLGNYPEKLVMYKNGILQPKQIEDNIMRASSLSAKNDGNWLYGHNGESTAYSGFLIEVVDDGVVYDSIAWENMISSFGDAKIYNNLVIGNEGHIIDPFSDSIPFTKAIMPVNKITNSRPGFVYSEPHGCYIYAHQTDYNAYISFFHGAYYNYLGSLLVDGRTDRISDIDVVDEYNYILVSLDTYNNFTYKLLFYHVRGNENSGKKSLSGHFNDEWFESSPLIRLPAIHKDNEQPFGF